MQYYHISANKLHGRTLAPRVPKNHLELEDSKTKRVCFSTAISGCGKAINADIWRSYYVYVPVNYNGDIIKPTKKKVPDVCVTREKWFMNKTRIKCIGKVYFYHSNQWHISDNYIYYSDYRLRFRWLEKF